MRNIDRLYAPKLVDDLMEFKLVATASRPYRMFLECLRRRHYKIALDIRRKYGYLFPIQSDDTIISSYFALMSTKK